VAPGREGLAQALARVVAAALALALALELVQAQAQAQELVRAQAQAQAVVERVRVRAEEPASGAEPAQAVELLAQPLPRAAEEPVSRLGSAR
jgi:Tfp pilus assembly protein PilV